MNCLILSVLFLPQKVLCSFCENNVFPPEIRAQILSTVCFFVVFLVLKQIPDPFFQQLFSRFFRRRRTVFRLSFFRFAVSSTFVLNLSTGIFISRSFSDLFREYYAHESHIFFCAVFIHLLKIFRSREQLVRHRKTKSVPMLSKYI